MRIVFVAALAAAVGCSSQARPRGNVSIALVSTGQDGTKYRLPLGSSVELNNPPFDLLKSLDAAVDTVSVTVPVGPYTATLYDPTQTVTTNWTLDQLDATGNPVGTVSATLLSTNPAQLTVTSGQTTSLVFAFRIPTGVTITFDTGTVDIGISTTQAPAQSYSYDSNSLVTISAASFGGPQATQLQNRLPGATTTPFSLEFGGPINGAWIEAGGTSEADGTYSVLACAPPDISVAVTNGPPGMADLVAEVGHGTDTFSLFGTASLCVADDGTNNFIRVRVSRAGTPGTATFSDLTQGELFWRFILVAPLAHRAYDATTHTIDLAQLIADTASGLQLQTSHVNVYEFVNGQPGQGWYSATFAGTTNFTFAGH